MAWTVTFSLVALKQLSKFPKDHQKQITDSADRMKADPFQGNVKPLKGAEWQGRYRKRIGRYRLIFIPDHQTRTVEITQVLLRSEKTYR